MSFFPRSFCAPAATEVSYAPLFRLLEDFDNYSREGQATPAAPAAPACRRQRTRQPRPQLATFKPRFDVRETENSYELYGELPGLERENVSIEFTEPQTIVIRGRVERSYGSEEANTSTTESTSQPTITDGAAPETTDAEKPRRNSYQPTVEDDPEDEFSVVSTPASSPKTEAAKPEPTRQVQETTQAQTQNGPKQWLSERSVGEFSRVFTFPARVDHDSVSASLSNGILAITVPKATKPMTRRIEISA